MYYCVWMVGCFATFNNAGVTFYKLFKIENFKSMYQIFKIENLKSMYQFTKHVVNYLFVIVRKKTF